MHLTLGIVISNFIWRVFTAPRELLASSALSMAVPRHIVTRPSLTFMLGLTLAPKDWLAFTAPEDSILRLT